MPAWRFEHESLIAFATGTVHRADCQHAPDELNGQRFAAGSVMESDKAPKMCGFCRPDATLRLGRVE